MTTDILDYIRSVLLEGPSQEAGLLDDLGPDGHPDRLAAVVCLGRLIQRQQVHRYRQINREGATVWVLSLRTGP